jgi:hypothetical protein
MTKMGKLSAIAICLLALSMIASVSLAGEPITVIGQVGIAYEGPVLYTEEDVYLLEGAGLDFYDGLVVRVTGVVEDADGHRVLLVYTIEESGE